jgi:hypothetical protein
MASGPVFMFCTPGLIFGSTEGLWSRFHVLRSRTCFRRYRGRRVPFPCFALLHLFSAVSRASGPVFIFCPPRLIFGGIEGVPSRFHVLCSQTHFRPCRVRRVPFSCFAHPDSFSAVPFSCFALGLVFGGTVGVGSRFHVSRSRTRFRRQRGRRVPFSCFARLDSFSAELRVSHPVFTICAPALVFGDTEGVGSLFHVLRSRTRFRRYRGRQVPFSCFRSRTRFRPFRVR